MGDSAEIDIAWADLISGYALATIIAAWAVGPMGNRGTGVDFSMTDLVVSHFNEYLAAASLGYDDDTADRANELAPFAPHGVYPTEDGWIAICVKDDSEFVRLLKVLDIPPTDTLLRPRPTNACSVDASSTLGWVGPRDLTVHPSWRPGCAAGSRGRGGWSTPRP